MTSFPPRTSRSHRWEPKKPAPPVTSTRFNFPPCRSPGARQSGNGAAVQAYDPKAMADAKEFYLKGNDRVTYCDTKYEALKGADALVLFDPRADLRRRDGVTLPLYDEAAPMGGVSLPIRALSPPLTRFSELRPADFRESGHGAALSTGIPGRRAPGGAELPQDHPVRRGGGAD